MFRFGIARMAASEPDRGMKGPDRSLQCLAGVQIRVVRHIPHWYSRVLADLTARDSG